MSATYNLEPNPTAKVLLHTTTGDLELELFAKQAPVTSRNFLQLCLDGYYDNTIFHRIIKGFIIQGGDPTGTGQSGESSYDGAPFEDEFHSRLKYTRRGLLGMANTGRKDDNGSQFFFTLAATPELQEKNTMFGRVAGDTIYNLMKMAEAEIREGSEDEPLYPTKIINTDIIINPFEDMVQRSREAQRTAPEEKKAKKDKRKVGKNVLSFDVDEDDVNSAPVAKKAKFNAKLVSVGEEKTKVASIEPKSIPIRKPSRRPSPQRSPSPKVVLKSVSKPPEKHESHHSPPREPSPGSEKQTKLDKVNAQIAELKASMKRSTISHTAESSNKKSLLESMVPMSTTRGRKRGARAGVNAAQEAATLDTLSKFKLRLESAEFTTTPTERSANDNDDAERKNGTLDNDKHAAEEERPCDLHFVVGCLSCKAWDKQDEEQLDDAGWMSHSLSFAKDRLGKDLEWKRKNEEELLVIDPREEAKKHKAGQRSKRD